MKFTVSEHYETENDLEFKPITITSIEFGDENTGHAVQIKSDYGEDLKPEVLAASLRSLADLIEGQGHGVASLSLFYLRAANLNRQAEWDPANLITIEYRGNEFAGEAGEVCNEVKKLARERLGIRGSRTTKDKLAEELADVVICADLIAMDQGIDLSEAVKYKFNKTSETVGLKTRM